MRNFDHRARTRVRALRSPTDRSREASYATLSPRLSTEAAEENSLLLRSLSPSLSPRWSQSWSAAAGIHPAGREASIRSITEPGRTPRREAPACTAHCSKASSASTCARESSTSRAGGRGVATNMALGGRAEIATRESGRSGPRSLSDCVADEGVRARADGTLPPGTATATALSPVVSCGWRSRTSRGVHARRAARDLDDSAGLGGCGSPRRAARALCGSGGFFFFFFLQTI
jgi:hypothetical protein